MKKPKLNIIVIVLLIAVLVADLFLDLRRHQFYNWLALFIYMAAVAISAFFENKWISKQIDQLKASYRVLNVSMWIFLLLATVSTVPNFFIAVDRTWLWPVSLVSFTLLSMTFMRRRELLRELNERDKSSSI
jgi:hypothetical protein